MWADSSAAIGICSRQGLGKLRHLDTHTLWIQQAVRTKRVDLRKVLGEVNPADLLTKHSISRQRLLELVTLYGCSYLGGRAESAPMARKGVSSKTTMAEAERAIGHTGEGDAPDAPKPRMPHNVYTAKELDAEHPTLQVPEKEELEDMQKDEEDNTLQTGLQIAKQINRETRLQ